MIKFEITSYPEAPCDFALYGALDWIASENGGDRTYLHDLHTLRRGFELAGLSAVDLLDMITREHLNIYDTSKH